MPELPEVETVVRGLQHLVLGHEIQHIQVKRPRIIRPERRLVFARQLKGHIIENVERYGKWIAFRLSDNMTLWSHLGMTGQFRWNDPDKYVRVMLELVPPAIAGGNKRGVDMYFPPAPWEGLKGGASVSLRGSEVTKQPQHVIPAKAGIQNICPAPWEGTKGWIENQTNILYYSDPRLFGRMLLDPNNEPTPPGVPMGLDPILQKVSGKYLYDQFHSRKTAIKDLLLNQEIIAGIGNIYASEILFDAHFHPLRPADSLTLKECQRLAKSIKFILGKAIDWCGTTLSDARYQTLDGSSGDYQDFLKVYGRATLPCYKCNTPLERYVLHGRSGVFCPKCQQ
jgi:formamidopyrimidine-DNA glycosylase